MVKRIVAISAFIVVLVAFCFLNVVSVSAGAPEYNSNTGWYWYKTIDALMLFWGSHVDGNGSTYAWYDLTLPSTKTLWLQGWYDEIWFEIDLIAQTGVPISVPTNKVIDFSMLFNLQISDSSEGWIQVPNDVLNIQVVTADGVMTTSRIDASGDDLFFGSRFINNTEEVVEITTLRFGLFRSADHPFPYTVNNIRVSIDELGYKLFSSDEVSADSIIGALGDLRDEITDGWSPNPIKPEGAGAIVDFDSVESALIDSTNAGLNSGVSYLQGLPSIFSRYTNAFGFVRGIWNQLLLPIWVNDLLIVSLSLGFLGVLFGLVPTLASRSSSYSDFKSDRKKNSNKKE